jgi:hypothetical protein
MILNCWIIVSFWRRAKHRGSAVFSDPSKRHGAKMTLLMRLAQNVTCFAVRLQPADFHDESDPRERWIVEAAPPPARAGGAGWSDKLKWMLPTAWFEQDVDDDDAEPRRRRRRCRAKRSACASLEKEEGLPTLEADQGWCTLPRLLQKCCKLAPQPPLALKTKRRGS